MFKDDDGGEVSTLDLHLGLRLRMRRQSLGADRKLIGAMAKLGEQAIADLEEGRRRFDAACLVRLASVLEVPVYWFYDGLEAVGESASGEPRNVNETIAKMALSQRLEVLKSYFEDMTEDQQMTVLDIARQLSFKAAAIDMQARG